MTIRKDSHHSTGRLICSTFFIIFISLFAGFFLGLLIAPQSGKRFRDSLRGWLAEMVERGKFTIEEAKVYGSEFLEKSKERVENISSKIMSDSKD